jgi:hypothetical protein
MISAQYANPKLDASPVLRVMPQSLRHVRLWNDAEWSKLPAAVTAMLRWLPSLETLVVSVDRPEGCNLDMAPLPIISTNLKSLSLVIETTTDSAFWDAIDVRTLESLNIKKMELNVVDSDGDVRGLGGLLQRNPGLKTLSLARLTVSVSGVCMEPLRRST